MTKKERGIFADCYEAETDGTVDASQQEGQTEMTENSGTIASAYRRVCDKKVNENKNCMNKLSNALGCSIIKLVFIDKLQQNLHIVSDYICYD